METKDVVGAVVVIAVLVTLTWLIFIPHPEKYDEYQNLAALGGSGSEAFEDASQSAELPVEVRSPQGYSTDRSYAGRSPYPDASIRGVAFRPSERITEGTNLAPDSFVSVELLSGAPCSPSSFILTDDPGRTVSLGGRAFLYAESRTAGAGNLYEEAAYVLDAGDDCIAVRKFAHFTSIGNYSPGTVREFDRAAFSRVAEDIARSLVIR